jgi:hypothetical protein
LSYLEWREKQYDVRLHVDVHDADGEVLVHGALVYIASPANSNYLGSADLRIIAAQIATCRGPSGPNWEYLFRLADAMRAMELPDLELFDLEGMVREQLAASWGEQSGSLGSVAGAAGVGIVESIDEAHGHSEFRRWHQVGAASLPAQQRTAASLQPDRTQGTAPGAPAPDCDAAVVCRSSSKEAGRSSKEGCGDVGRLLRVINVGAISEAVAGESEPG